MKFIQWVKTQEPLFEEIDKDFMSEIKQKIERAASPTARSSMISSTHQAMQRILKAFNSYRPETIEANIVDKFLQLLKDNNISVPDHPEQSDTWEAVKTLWNRAAISPQIPPRAIKNASSARIPNPQAREVPQEIKQKFQYPMGSEKLRSLIVDAVKKSINKEPAGAILTMASMKPVNSDKDLADVIVGVLRQMGISTTVDKLPPEYKPSLAAPDQGPTQKFTSDLGGSSSGIAQVDPKQERIDRNSQSVLNIKSLSEIKPTTPGAGVYKYLFVINNNKFYKNPYYDSKA